MQAEQNQRLTRYGIWLAIGLAGFVYGLLSATYEFFPFKALQSVHQTFANKPAKIDSTITFRDIGEGFWHVARHSENETLDKQKSDALAKLASLPYLRGSKSAKDVENVTLYSKGLAADGLNLFVSGHGPEAHLIDMEGRLRHKWRYAFEDVWSEPLPFDEWRLHQTFWRRAHLYPNGDLLAVFEGIGLIKLDAQSNLLWAYQGRNHHDLFVAESGTIFTLTRQWRKQHPSIIFEERFLEDFITQVSPDGKALKSVSILDCFLNSEYASVLINMKRKGDVFHTNTLEIMDGRLGAAYPMFAKGNALISIPTMQLIAVIDLQQETVVWAMTGMWIFQHQPTLLDNGHIMLFDNLGDGGKSKVIEIDPLTQEVVWLYRGTKENEFFSQTCSSNQRLANGNTLITESNTGRAFEVTPDKEIVWEFLNPFRAGKNNELVASLFDLVRFDKRMFAGQEWMSEKSEMK